jgi:asparagine synthase (glutamine-hydrolysing)
MMSGIYGICEPGVQLQTHQLEPLSLAWGFPEGRRYLPIGGNGALLGASHCLNVPPHGDEHGLFVAVDADLNNYSALLTEHQRSNGDSISSSEDLVAVLYARHGLNFIERLEGAFSLALWDAQRQRLVLAIDRFGFKVMYCSMERGRISFSSRLSAVACTRQQIEVDPAAVMQFLVHTVVPAPLTIYKGIERLEPGTLLVYEQGQTRKTRYWDLDYEESSKSGIGEWSEELRECMREAVHSHLAGCQPEQTGAYLSGGTDSSSVVAFATEVHSPVNTFSIYFENPRYDEVGFSRLAAECFRTRHHERCLQANDAVQAIPKIIDYYEEPFANSSAIGSYHCARLARESGVDVLLAGDGGDELFAGNERYAADKRFAPYHSIPAMLRKGVIKPAASLLPRTGLLSYPARYIRRAEIPNPRRMLSYNFFLTPADEAVFEPDFLDQASPENAYDIAQVHFDSAPHATSELNRLLYLDVKMTLADNDLRKVTGTAELAGVHVRYPLLDRRLAELSARIPSNLKLRGFEKRYIFKQAMKHTLPDRILYKKKHGFGVPVGYWMLHDEGMKSLAAVLDEPQTRQRGYFRPEFLARIQELNHTHPAYYGEVLWIVLVLELWHRRHGDFHTREVAACGGGTANAG